MTTIYLGDGLVSYEDPRFSHLSKQAREATYFEQFRPENLGEIRTVPTLTIVGAALIGFLAFGSLFSDDAAQSTLSDCVTTPVRNTVKEKSVVPDRPSGRTASVAKIDTRFRSAMMASAEPLVSPVTRLLASLEMISRRPSGEKLDPKEKLSP